MNFLASFLIAVTLHTVQVEACECGTCGALLEPARYYIPNDNDEWIAVCWDCFYL